MDLRIYVKTLIKVLTYILVYDKFISIINRM